MNQNPHQPPDPVGFWLCTARHAVPLSIGATVSTDDLPGLTPPGAIIAQVNAHPKQPGVLGLENLSNKAWSAKTDGGERTIAPQQSIKLAHGTLIDFGGAMAGISSVQPPQMHHGADCAPPSAPQPPSGFKAVPREEIERLSRTLARAASEAMVTQQQFDKLHGDFYAEDGVGGVWTFGLKSRRWHRGDGQKWEPAVPPEELWMLPETVNQVMALKRRPS